MKLCVRLAVAATVLWAAGSVHAGRPLVTEDAGVLERASCEFESFVARVRARGGPAATGISVQVGCAILGRSQVALAASRDKADDETLRGVMLSGKTALNEPSETGTAFALAWGLAAARTAGGSYRHEDSFATAVASVPVAAGWTVHANLGWSRAQASRQSSTLWALAAEHETTERLSLMAETFASDRDRSPWVQLAARWAWVPERLFIDGSWGVQTSPERPRMFTLGLKAVF